MSQSDQDKDAIIAALREENAAQKERIALLEQKVDYLIKQLYGKKSEKLDPSQLELLLNPEEAKKPDAAECDQDVPAADQEQENPAGKPRRKRQSRLRKSMESLPCIEEVIDPDEVKENPEAFRRIGEEVSERLEVSPARYYRKRTVRPTYVSKIGPQGAPNTAVLPAPLLEGSVLSASLAADILSKKYCYHMPFQRQEWELRTAYGIEISRALMCCWHGHLAGVLEPLYKLIASDLRNSGYLQVDETPIGYLEPGHGKTKTGYMWVYHNPEAGVLYDWHSSRAGTCLDNILIDKITGEHFKGVMQTDGYSAYIAWLLDKIDIIRAACLAHIRRKFIEAKDDHPAHVAAVLKLIARIYVIEAELRESGADAGQRLAVRQTRTRPVLDELYQTIIGLSQRNDILPKGPLGKALTYAKGQWSATAAWTEYGEIELDNNGVENRIRPTKLGAKNWLFIGGEDTGWRTAVIYTMIENVRYHGKDPRAYLEWVFERLPAMTNQQDLRELLPAAWVERQNAGAKSA